MRGNTIALRDPSNSEVSFGHLVSVIAYERRDVVMREAIPV